tara:strand:- start:6 stop:785 length:780 start_codon:yes stop_codon:yes gene_type:complete
VNIDTTLPSSDINRSIKGLLTSALSIYQIDVPLLKTAAPDVILTQSQCDVCAVSEAELSRAVGDWFHNGIDIVSLKSNQLKDIWQDITNIAKVIDANDRGRALISKIKVSMTTIDKKCAALRSRPRVACIEWIAPLMAAGNWVPELISMAGGINLFGDIGSHSPWMDWEELKSADPDVMIVMPCGFNLKRCRAEMFALTGSPGWEELSCVKAGDIFLADGNQYFNRPGPRIAQSLEIIAEILHPHEFKPKYEGTGWERY